jgi:indolepyruvate ferredoxin oxidoreductase alpha subunit
MAGEYTAQALLKGLSEFLETHQPLLLRNRPPLLPENPLAAFPEVLKALTEAVPPRPPGFCVGCPERPIFAAIKLVEQDLGTHHVTGDIGCHLFSILPPFNIGTTTMGYGLGPASASALSVKAGKRAISIMGDGGFWHNGLATSIANAAYNRHDGVTVIVDNHYSAATGGQDIPSSRASHDGRKTNISIASAVKGAGVSWVREIGDTYDVAHMRDTLHEALTTPEAGPKVIIASSECMLNRERREKPKRKAAIAKGERTVAARFGVDEDICTGDRACIRLSGCPSLSLKDRNDPLRDDPVVTIDESCVGCGNCGEVAEAAVLCPSFYRADIVHNPSGWDRFKARVRSSVTGFFRS